MWATASCDMYEARSSAAATQVGMGPEKCLGLYHYFTLETHTSPGIWQVPTGRSAEIPADPSTHFPQIVDRSWVGFQYSTGACASTQRYNIQLTGPMYITTTFILRLQPI
jgi:hypothetical protein